MLIYLDVARSNSITQIAITATSNDRHDVSNYRSIECLFESVFRPQTTKKFRRSALRSFCEGKPPVTVGFPAQMDANADNVSIWCRHISKTIGSTSNVDSTLPRQIDIKRRHRFKGLCLLWDDTIDSYRQWLRSSCRCTRKPIVLVNTKIIVSDIRRNGVYFMTNRIHNIPDHIYLLCCKYTLLVGTFSLDDISTNNGSYCRHSYTYCFPGNALYVHIPYFTVRICKPRHSLHHITLRQRAPLLKQLDALMPSCLKNKTYFRCCKKLFILK